MIKLGVNIDHVATVREARGIKEPDPVHAAVIAQLGGADSIVCHLREDRRHIKERDLKILKEIVHTRLNLEMAMSQEIIEIALKVRPDQITLVPERREELTTEGGLDVIANKNRIKEVVKRFHDAGIQVSLFIDPIREQIETARDCKVNIIEIHTGAYSNAKKMDEIKREFAKISLAAMIGRNLRLFVAAGHGLNYKNVIPIARIPEIEELNIGHSIIARAIFTGIKQAVWEMKELINKYRITK
jgi:pyridoxine 5-phosphate synthase